jgi:hypothetical protein
MAARVHVGRVRKPFRPIDAISPGPMFDVDRVRRSRERKD